MKKALVLGLLILFSPVISPAAVRLGLSGGYAKHLESDFGGGLAAGFTLALDLTAMFSVEARAARIASGVTGSPASLSQGRMILAPLEVAFVARFGGGKKLVPYVAAGGGYGLNSFKLDSTLLNDWSNMGMSVAESLKGGLTILAGAGLDYELKRGEAPGRGLFFNVEVRYLMGKADGTWSLTDNASREKAEGVLEGLKLDTLVIGLGLKYGF